MNFKFFNFILLCTVLSGLNGWSQNHQVWQIGQEDKSGKEFALYDNYRSFNKNYPGGAMLYHVNLNKAEDIPYFLPGPSDSWAGGVNGQLIIRFGIDKIENGTTARLKLSLLDTHPNIPPMLEFTVNGYSQRIKSPGGKRLNYLDSHARNVDYASIEVTIPAGQLKKGDNTIGVKNTSGSWIAIDAITLYASQPVATGKATGNDVFVLYAESVPALIYGKKKELLQPVTLTVANWARKSQKVNINIEGNPAGSYQVAPGISKLDLAVLETDREKTVGIELFLGNKSMGKTTIAAKPVKKWTIYLVQHTHTDIGYTKPQTEILMEHLRYIDYAIEYCELTENYPDDSKFRWACEASWAVNEYLKNRPKEKTDKLKKYIANGQIETTAMFFNMAEIVDENSLKTFLKPLSLYKENRIPVYTAMQNDVNGIAWCLADYLPDLDVKYVWMGEHGHRALIPFAVPTVFKWESPSGKQILTYRADHYMTGNRWGVEKDNFDAIQPQIFSYLTNLENKGYPFDAVGIQYSGYSTDNSPPSFNSSKNIEEWNNKYAYPKLRAALPREFMDYIADNYRDKLQTLRVAYPDWWTDGFGSAARETGASRSAHADMVTVEGMLSMAMAKGEKLPGHIRDKITHIHENLLFYDEHTFGSSESLRNPTSWNSQVQWAEKGSFVWEGLKSAQLMYESSAGLLQDDLRRGEHPTITFFNSMGWSRSTLATVYIDFEVLPQDREFSIVDATGKSLHVQPLQSRREGRYYAIYAEDIPAMGYKTYNIVIGAKNDARLPPPVFADNVLENGYYRIKFNAENGAITSLYDKELDKEMVDRDSPWQLGAFIYEKLEDRAQMERYTTDRFERSGLSRARLSPGVNGPIYQSVNIRGNAPGIDPDFGMQAEVRLFNNTKRIEFSFSVKRLPETDPSGLYVAFPFALDNGKLAFEVQGGVVYPGENQLEGTASDWNTVQNFAAVRNNEAQFVFGSDAVPLMQLGDLLGGPFQYKKIYEKPHIYSWVMNNYWVTNFRASQEGEFRWNYYLTSTPDVSNTAASRFGWNSRIPMYARVMPVGKPNNRPMDYSAFEISDKNLLMTSCTISKDDGYLLLNIRELDGTPVDLRLTGMNGQALSFTVVNSIEGPLTSVVNSISFKPFENKFIKLKVK
jgi:hypothetical protein